MPPATTVSQPVLPADVIAFAAEKGVSDYLPAVLEMTRQVFPNCPVVPLVEDDPEIPDWRAIVMQVDVTGMNVEQLVAAQQRWSAALFQHCPATHVHLFAYVPWATS